MLTKPLEVVGCQSLTLRGSRALSESELAQARTSFGYRDKILQKVCPSGFEADGKKHLLYGFVGLVPIDKGTSAARIQYSFLIQPGEVGDVEIEEDDVEPCSLDVLLTGLQQVLRTSTAHLQARFLLPTSEFRPIVALPLREGLEGTPFTEIRGLRLYAPRVPEQSATENRGSFEAIVELVKDQVAVTITARMPVVFQPTDFDASLQRAVELSQLVVLPSRRTEAEAHG